MQDFLIPAERLGETYTTWQKRMRRRGFLLACGAVSCALVIGAGFAALLFIGGLV